jgi:hypothetical protein
MRTIESQPQLLNDEPEYTPISLERVRDGHKIVLMLGSGRIPLLQYDIFTK